MLTRRALVLALPCLGLMARAGPAQAAPGAAALIAAARTQIGVTVTYDPAYVRLDYPMGDVPRDRGVCTDVVIRAFRDALGLDLQRLVHEDMRAHFARYPQNWGLTGTDRNIDHRRVPNLRTFFRRKGQSFESFAAASDFAPGDLVTSVLPGNLPHIMIVSDQIAPGSGTPLVIHNIGQGTREEDRLFAFPLTGRYRFGLEK